MNHATRAANYLRSRYTRGAAHQAHDVDPQPDADGSTAFLEDLSAELLREKLVHRPLVKHPDRHQTWVREISDRGQPVEGPSPVPGRETLGGAA